MTTQKMKWMASNQLNQNHNANSVWQTDRKRKRDDEFAIYFIVWKIMSESEQTHAHIHISFGAVCLFLLWNRSKLSGARDMPTKRSLYLVEKVHFLFLVIFFCFYLLLLLHSLFFLWQLNPAKILCACVSLDFCYSQCHLFYWCAMVSNGHFCFLPTRFCCCYCCCNCFFCWFGHDAHLSQSLYLFCSLLISLGHFSRDACCWLACWLVSSDLYAI